MSKKRKCINCGNRMNWALPVRVTEQNIDYARHCLRIAQRTFVCGITMKTKQLDQEQYCKYFREDIDKRDDDRMEAISKLRKMIEEYEQKHRDWKDNFMLRFTQLN